jgi:hypothetical protein
MKIREIQIKIPGNPKINPGNPNKNPGNQIKKISYRFSVT